MCSWVFIFTWFGWKCRSERILLAPWDRGPLAKNAGQRRIHVVGLYCFTRNRLTDFAAWVHESRKRRGHSVGSKDQINVRSKYLNKTFFRRNKDTQDSLDGNNVRTLGERCCLRLTTSVCGSSLFIAFQSMCVCVKFMISECVCVILKNGPLFVFGSV